MSIQVLFPTLIYIHCCDVRIFLIQIIYFEYGETYIEKITSFVTMNSLAAPLHHCYYFEVAVLLSLSSSQHIILPHAHTYVFALHIFLVQVSIPFNSFEMILFYATHDVPQITDLNFGNQSSIENLSTLLKLENGPYLLLLNFLLFYSSFNKCPINF